KGDRKTVDGRAQSRRILQQGRDVVEENARLRKVGNVADFCFQLVHGHSTKNPVSRPVGVTTSTSTSSTRAAGGPWRSERSNRSSASSSPSAAASTRPSGRFLTQPCTP